MIDVESGISVIVEAVNARDPKLAGELDIAAPDALEETLQQLDERWPRLMLTRGDLDGSAVGVVWMPDRNEAYRKVGHVELRPEDDTRPLEIIEGPRPGLVAEEPAGRRVAEWESGDAMDRGEGPWV